MTKPIATFVKEVPGKGTKYLYKVPVTEETPEGYVLSSAVEIQFMGRSEPETYLFRADETGKVTNWLELEGSEKGYCDPDRAMENVYDVVTVKR
jgi:hypothetical protein